MDVNFNVKFMWDSDTHIIQLLKKIGIQMATFQEIVEAARAEQDVIVASINVTNALVKEVKQLLAMGDVPGAQELLDTIAANSAALVAANIENTNVTLAVDAVNAEPQ
jgi:cell division protein ZapA (FtsZ GTPase activity inhibitor)